MLLTRVVAELSDAVRVAGRGGGKGKAVGGEGAGVEKVGVKWLWLAGLSMYACLCMSVYVCLSMYMPHIQTLESNVSEGGGYQSEWRYKAF